MCLMRPLARSAPLVGTKLRHRSVDEAGLDELLPGDWRLELTAVEQRLHRGVEGAPVETAVDAVVRLIALRQQIVGGLDGVAGQAGLRLGKGDEPGAVALQGAAGLDHA